MSDMGGMSMQMYLYWSTGVQLYFSWWKTNSEMSLYCASLAAMVALGLIYEGATVVAALLAQRVQKARVSRGVARQASWTDPRCNVEQLAIACMYLIRVFFAYAVMLAIMTYNGGVIIACFSGMFIGNFCFGRFLYTGCNGPSGHVVVADMGCH